MRLRGFVEVHAGMRVCVYGWVVGRGRWVVSARWWVMGGGWWAVRTFAHRSQRRLYLGARVGLAHAGEVRPCVPAPPQRPLVGVDKLTVRGPLLDLLP